jgi:hypothetical protein
VRSVRGHSARCGADDGRRLLAAPRLGERSLQPGRREPSANPACARRQPSAQNTDVAAEGSEKFAAGGGCPAAMLRGVLHRLGAGFRIAIHMVRHIWHRVEPTSSMVREGTRKF